MKTGFTPRDAEIFRKAARLLERGVEVYACNAIWRAAHPRKSWNVPAERDAHPLVQRFTELFKPKHTTPYAAWFGSYSEDENKDRRIVALGFAAAITERP